METLQPIIVTVPARSEFVHVVRTVVAGVAARLDFSYDAIDDLRIAVDEACAHLLEGAPGATSITVTLAPGADALEVLVATDADGAAWPPERFESSLAWQVLSALADEARLEDGTPAVRFRKRLEAAGG